MYSLYSNRDGQHVWEADGSTVKHCQDIAKMMAKYLRAEFVITNQVGKTLAKSDNTATHRMNWVAA